MVQPSTARNKEPAMAKSKVTTDHNHIKRWVEERGAVPATVKATKSKGDPGVLRLDFPPRDESLEPVEWDDFFKKFDDEGLAFLYQDMTAAGRKSRFHKFINRS
jgi:hypothetical protein